MLGGILQERKEAEMYPMEVDFEGSVEDLQRIAGKRPKADYVKKLKNRGDKVRDSLTILAGLLGKDSSACHMMPSSEDDRIDEDELGLGIEEDNYQSKYKGPLLDQEYASTLNKHSKAGGV